MNLYNPKPAQACLMKMIWSAVFALFAVSGTMHAQSILGSWQGKLPILENPRVILRIEGDAGSLHGVLYRIDQSADGIRLSSVSFANTELNATQINLDMTFSGKMSDDGKSIQGMWTLGKQAYPLTLMHATAETLWKHDTIIPLAPMAATADPAFEVATVKPSVPGAPQRGDTRTRHLKLTSYTVLDLITFAYEVRLRQIEGAPAWLSDAKFDIAGEPDAEGQPSTDQYRLMVKKLLAERFQLKTHSVQQIFPVLALMRDKNSPKLQPSDPEFYRGSIYVKDMPGDMMQVQFVGQTMPMLADVIMNFIQDRQIVDETGLVGHFDFGVSVSAAEMRESHGVGPEDSRADVMLRAVQAMGFKLVPKKEPIEVVVIDHVEKPSEN